jgi:hypothetical protein
MQGFIFQQHGSHMGLMLSLASLSAMSLMPDLDAGEAPVPF